MRLTYSFAFIGLFIIPINLFAQENDTLHKELGFVNVIATRVEKKSAETGRSITVLTHEDIKRSTFTTLGELLQQQAGITMIGTGQTPGSNQSLFMRGANSNQTAIYLDGVRITDPTTVNNTLDLSELPLNTIERIEIIRGSHSTLYGSSAMGGVIQIETNKNATMGLHGDVSVTGGVFGKKTSLISPVLNLSYKHKSGFYLSGNEEYSDVKGLDATVDTLANTGVYDVRDQDNWKKELHGISTGFERTKWSAGVSYRGSDMKTDIDHGAYSDDGNYTLHFMRQFISGNVACRFSDNLSFEANAGYHKTERRSVNDSSQIDFAGNNDHTYTTDTFKSESFQADAIIKYKMTGNTFIAGISPSTSFMKQRNFIYSAQYAPFIVEINSNLDTVNTHVNEQDYYAQSDIQLPGFLKTENAANLVAGARMIHHSLFGNYLTWELNPSVKFNEHSLIYLSYSTGFNSPALYQLFSPEFYLPYSVISPVILTRGNSNLKPETSQSIELGCKGEFNPRNRFSLSIFRQVTKNLIDYVYLWDASIPVAELTTDISRDDYRGDRYINIGKQTSYGLELEFESELSEHFKIRFNANLLDGYLDSKPSAEISKQSGGNRIQLYNSGVFLDQNTRYDGLVRRPQSGIVQFTWMPNSKFTAGISFRYTDKNQDVFYDNNILPYGALNKKEVDSYSIVDFDVRYRIVKWLSVQARIGNLFDTDYQEIYGFRTMGRSGFLKIAAAF